MPHRVITAVVKRRAIGFEDVISLLILAIVLGALFLGSYGLYRNIQSANETKVALCALKYNIIERRDATQKLITENPDSEEIFKIPVEVLENSVRTQTATIAALRVLSCPQDHPQGG